MRLVMELVVVLLSATLERRFSAMNRLRTIRRWAHVRRARYLAIRQRSFRSRWRVWWRVWWKEEDRSRICSAESSLEANNHYQASPGIIIAKWSSHKPCLHSRPISGLLRWTASLMRRSSAESEVSTNSAKISQPIRHLPELERAGDGRSVRLSAGDSQIEWFNKFDSFSNPQNDSRDGSRDDFRRPFDRWTSRWFQRWF